MELDKTFEERDKLNQSIVESINKAAEPWAYKYFVMKLKT